MRINLEPLFTTLNHLEVTSGEDKTVPYLAADTLLTDYRIFRPSPTYQHFRAAERKLYYKCTVIKPLQCNPFVQPDSVFFESTATFYTK